MKENQKELTLIFPNKEYKSQVMDYLEEHIKRGEDEIHGDGALDRIKNFDQWLEKVQKEAKGEDLPEGKVPATIYLAIRKRDNRLIGMIQIRHELTKQVLSYGHIGDSIRPSERGKGYGTEMIQLALEKCKELGINRVLMICDKENKASARTIQKNGGILEKETQNEQGKIEQRYWISLKKRMVNRNSETAKVKQKQKEIKENDFIGDIYLHHFVQVNTPFYVNNNKLLCIQDTGYKWLEFYDYKAKVKLTAIYDETDKIVEWYFDIAREIGKENGIPYEDDMYLDVVVRPNGEIILLDEEELKEALTRYEITQEEYEETYQIAKDLMKQVKGKKAEIQEFTDKYLQLMLLEI